MSALDTYQLDEAIAGLARLEERCPGLLRFLSACFTVGEATFEDIQSKGKELWNPSDLSAAIGWLALGGLVTRRLASKVGQQKYVSAPHLGAVLDASSYVTGALPALRRHLERDLQSQLVVSWPEGVPEPRHDDWRNSRVVFLELIDTAQSELVVAFPFMDETGLLEVRNALMHAVSRGIGVVLITRFLSDPNSSSSELARELEEQQVVPNQLRTVHLEALDAKGQQREMLHAKVLVVDGGRIGYVGSANLTGAALNNTLEIGVVVRGATAASVYKLLRDVVRLANT